MEREEIPLRALNRQHTLESQRQRQPSPGILKWLAGMFNSPPQEPGPVAEIIDTMARTHNRNYRGFLQDFGHMYRRPKARLHDIFDIFIRLPHSAVESNETAAGSIDTATVSNGATAQSNEGAAKPNTIIIGEERFQPPKNINMYDWLSFLRLRLKDVDADSFVLCCFTAENPMPGVALMYNILKPFPWQVQRRVEVPRVALIYLYLGTQSWHKPESWVTMIAHATRPQDFDVCVELPSTIPSSLSDRDKNSKELVWTIKWQHIVDKYITDLDTYIWQPHNTPPPFCYANIIISTNKVPGVHRALVLFSTTRSLKSFRQQYDSTSATFSSIGLSAIGLLHTLYIVHRVSLTETKEFLEDIRQQVTDITFQSRVRPTKEKFQHLLFLNDCRKRAELDMASNLRLIDDCSRILKRILHIVDDSGEAEINDSEEAEILQRTTNELRTDINYIKEQLMVVGKRIETLQIEVESQNTLQSRNTTMLTILAAIYVPLAFVTSFLGMNISEGSVHKWLNITSYNNNNNNNNNNNQGSPSPQVWDLRWFALLSGPLLFGTIMLPLITGPAIRYLCHSYVSLRVYWRLGFFLLAIAYLAVYLGLALTVVVVADVLDLCCTLMLSLYVFYQVYDAWRFGGRRLIWSFCLFLVLVVWLMTLNVIPSGPVLVPLGFIGWVVIFFVSQVLYRLESRAKRRADTTAS